MAQAIKIRRYKEKFSPAIYAKYEAMKRSKPGFKEDHHGGITDTKPNNEIKPSSEYVTEAEEEENPFGAEEDIGVDMPFGEEPGEEGLPMEGEEGMEGEEEGEQLMMCRPYNAEMEGEEEVEEEPDEGEGEEDEAEEEPEEEGKE